MRVGEPSPRGEREGEKSTTDWAEGFHLSLFFSFFFLPSFLCTVLPFLSSVCSAFVFFFFLLSHSFTVHSQLSLLHSPLSHSHSHFTHQYFLFFFFFFFHLHSHSLSDSFTRQSNSFVSQEQTRLTTTTQQQSTTDKKKGVTKINKQPCLTLVQPSTRHNKHRRRSHRHQLPRLISNNLIVNEHLLHLTLSNTHLPRQNVLFIRKNKKARLYLTCPFGLAQPFCCVFNNTIRSASCYLCSPRNGTPARSSLWQL